MCTENHSRIIGAILYHVISYFKWRCCFFLFIHSLKKTMWVEISIITFFWEIARIYIQTNVPQESNHISSTLLSISPPSLSVSFCLCVDQVNLVSEHIWCKDFLVRSFYLKNVQTQETRTLTQFHLLSWPADGIPTSTRPLLDFRR